MSNFLDAVRSTIQKHRMLKPKDRLLVGVSGGPDSMALLSALVALRGSLRLNLRAAYVDHGLRPADAPREAALVRKMGRLWGVPVRILRRKVRKEGGESLEAVAREVRYRTLTGLAIRTGCKKIALGHTEDDQAETVLMWILRGAGTAGLAGIPPVRKQQGITIIRPLIQISRAQVEGYLKDHRIQALQDRSNESRKFLRNQIRHELIPLLEKRYSPRFRRHVSTLAEIVRADLDWLESQGRAALRRMSRLGKDRIRLSRRKLVREPAALRRAVLRSAIAKLQGDRNGFTARHWMALDELLLEKDPSPMDLPHGFRAEFPDSRWLLIRRANLVN